MLMQRLIYANYATVLIVIFLELKVKMIIGLRPLIYQIQQVTIQLAP